MAKQITLKINEQSKFGKILLELIKMGVDEKKIQVIPTPNQTTLSAMANVEAGKKLTKTTSHTDLMQKLNA